MGTVLAFIFRAGLLAAGLVLALSFAFALAVLVAAWLLRAAWARLTGRRVAPFVMRMSPREGFRYAYRGRAAASRTPRADAVSPVRAVGDITDVEARPPSA